MRRLYTEWLFVRRRSTLAPHDQMHSWNVIAIIIANNATRSHCFLLRRSISSVFNRNKFRPYFRSYVRPLVSVWSPPVRPSVRPCVRSALLFSLSVPQSICLFVRHLPSSYIWMCLSILLSVRSSVLLSVYVSVHLSVYICPSISSCISVHLSFYISSFAHSSIPPSMRSTAFLAEHLSDVWPSFYPSLRSFDLEPSINSSLLSVRHCCSTVLRFVLRRLSASPWKPYDLSVIKTL